MKNKTLTKILNLTNYIDPVGHQSNLEAKDKYIKEQLKLDPNYVGYDFLSHYLEYDYVITDPMTILSTKGEVFKLTKEGWTRYHGSATTAGYLRIFITKTIRTYIHRVMGSTFLLKDEKYKDTLYTELTINHKNGIKVDNGIDNLEWMSNLGNVMHAKETGLNVVTKGLENPDSIPLLGEVVLDCEIKGHKFIMAGSKEFSDAGMNNSAPLLVIKGDRETAYGCKWVVATEEDIKKYPLGCPEFLVNKLKNEGSDLRIKPILCTILKGPHAGYQFVLMGGNEVKAAGYDQANVNVVCNGKRSSHKGTKFEYITHEEAKNYPRGVTQEIRDSIK